MPSSAVAPQNGQEPVEGFAVDAAADAAHVAGYRADLRGDSWRVCRFAQQDVLWHVLSLASWFAALLGSMP